MVTRRWFAFLLLSLAALAPRALVGQTVCLPFATACRTNVITGPNKVSLSASGGTFTLGTRNMRLFSFMGPIAVWVRPATAGTSGGLLTGAVALCGSGIPGLMGGSATCTQVRGRRLSITIPQALVDTLLQRGLVSPSGFWNLYAMNARTNVEAPLPHTIRFTPPGPSPPVPNPAPYISDFSVSPSAGGHPKCVPENASNVTINVQGQNFDASARIIVSHIYFVDRHGTFQTDFYGRDSRVGASMDQQTPTYLSGSVNLQFIHNTAGDNFGLGGNYYVQVQNGSGQVNGRSPNYFTVLPYGGGDSRCR